MAEREGRFTPGDQREIVGGGGKGPFVGGHGKQVVNIPVLGSRL